MRNRKASLFTLALLLIASAIPEAHAMRWYSPNTGRWLSRDPIENVEGANQYTFARNSPIVYWDYLGQMVLIPPSVLTPPPSGASDATAFETRLQSLCPTDHCMAMKTRSFGVQCCCPRNCRIQATVFATRLAQKVTSTFNANKAKHGNVIGGYFGNWRREFGTDYPFWTTPSAGVIDKDGRNCLEWTWHSQDSWKEILKIWFENGKGCFPLMSVDHASFPGAGAPLGLGKGSHTWAGIFGPKPMGVAAVATAADIYIDPWPNGGLTIIAPHTTPPQGSAGLGSEWGFK